MTPEAMTPEAMTPEAGRTKKAETDTERASAETWLPAAMFRLCNTHPYLASALWAMTRVPAPGIGTLGVDAAWRLYYDPGAIARSTVPELSAVLYHVVSHLLRDHAGRRPDGLSRVVWNVCADAEINDGLRDEGQPLPERSIFPSTLNAPDGRLAEEYLTVYAEKIQAQGAGSQGLETPSEQPSDEQEESCLENEAQPGANEAQPGANEAQPGANEAQPGGDGFHPAPTQPGPCCGRCGSGAGGLPEEWEVSLLGGHTAILPTEAELLRRQTARAIQDHVRARGIVPGGWQRWAKQRLEPQTDWRRELASQMRRSLADVFGAVDYSYRQPSRRQSCLGGAIMPSLRRPVPHVAVIVDTSGSVTDVLLDRALAEVTGILRAAGQREGVTVLAVDAVVRSSRRVFRTEQVSLPGGGGTDMRAGLEAAQAMHPRPDIVVVITDGLTPWPAAAPRSLRTVVVLTGDGTSPPWAKTIRMPKA